MSDLTDSFDATFVCTADEWAWLHEPVNRKALISLVPAAVLIGLHEPNEEGLVVIQDYRFTPSDIDTLYWLLAHPDTVDELAAELEAQDVPT